MSILIKGVEMSKNCDKCKFFAWKLGVGQHCAVDDRITFHATIDGMDVAYERNGNCPLVEVPPHGRLIDADALMNSLPMEYPSVVMAISSAPTIIEAEEGET